MRLIAMLLIFAAFAAPIARASASGAYATADAASRGDCVKLCDDDTLCVGWTYDAGACAMWASVPRQPPSHLTLSHRAPDFARRVEVAETISPPVPAPRPPNPAPRENAAVALLGGDNRGEDIRPRLGGN